MFTGIIENTGVIQEVRASGTNKTFWISSALVTELKIDQSLAHDGVCLTIEEIKNDCYKVTAVQETLAKTTLQHLEPGYLFNLERSLELPARLDGHIVQGHADTTAICIAKDEKQGSWIYEFQFPDKFAPLIVEKGSIAVNGISLTIFEITNQTFKVAVIPYTYTNTNIRNLEKSDIVNIEFDIVGKYVLRNQLLVLKST